MFYGIGLGKQFHKVFKRNPLHVFGDYTYEITTTLRGQWVNIIMPLSTWLFAADDIFYIFRSESNFIEMYSSGTHYKGMNIALVHIMASNSGHIY